MCFVFFWTVENSHSRTEDCILETKADCFSEIADWAQNLRFLFMCNFKMMQNANSYKTVKYVQCGQPKVTLVSVPEMVHLGQGKI